MVIRTKQAYHFFNTSLYLKAWFLSLLVIAGILSGCNTTRFLNKEKGEIFLKENKIRIEESTGKVKKKSKLSYDLAKLVKQKPNRRFFWVPRQFFYYQAQDSLYRSGFGNKVIQAANRIFGEEPIFVDTALAAQTSKNMQFYLQSSGYFFAEVQEEISVSKRGTKASVTYVVTPGGRFTIDTVIFICRDSNVQKELDAIRPNTLLKKGEPIDVKLYEREVLRITNWLQNHGYAYFYPQYVSNLEGYDSSNVSRTAKLRLEILTPPGRETHPKCTIGNIYLNPEYDPVQASKVEYDTVVNGVFFATNGAPMRVKPETLANSIFFKTGQVYSEQTVEDSRNQLSSLGVYYPPSLKFEIDSVHPELLNFYLELRPTKKWEFGADFDVSTTTRSVVSGSLIGFTLSPSIRNRNFLKGAELLIGTVDMGLDLPLLSSRGFRINTLDFRVQTDLYIPRFTDYFRLWRQMHKWGAVGEYFYNNLIRKATSRFSMSYNQLALIDNYNLRYFNFVYGYDIPLSLTRRLIVNHFGIDLVVPSIIANSEFDSILIQNPYLRRSFSSQFITGLLFRDMTFIYSSRPNQRGNTWFLRGYFDLSGLEIFAANALYNQISGKNNDFEFFQVDFSHYAKIETEARHYWQLGPNRTLVARFNGGVASPFYHSNATPYIKQFFVGGPNSLRGWYQRGLGPGLYLDPLSNDPGRRNQYYQSADFKLEFNLEYRFLMAQPFNLFNLYAGVFFDGGNIWTLKEDPDRIGSRLAFSRKVSENQLVEDAFWKEIAISTGFGLRFDFQYVIMRLDFGFPLKNNYPDPLRSNSYWRPVSDFRLKDFVPNLGLGYPF
jgi:hypothetical protein